MSKIRIEFECNDNAAEFFNNLMEDARDLFKDEETLEQFDSIEYTIKERPQLYVDQLLKVISSSKEFESYIDYEVTNDLDGATVDLIAAAYDLDGDEMSDESLLCTIRAILNKRQKYIAKRLP